MRILLITGIALVAFDVARWNMTGVAVLGAVLLLIWAWSARVFTLAFWVQPDPAVNARLAEVDADLEERGL